MRLKCDEKRNCRLPKREGSGKERWQKGEEEKTEMKKERCKWKQEESKDIKRDGKVSREVEGSHPKSSLISSIDYFYRFSSHAYMHHSTNRQIHHAHFYTNFHFLYSIPPLSTCLIMAPPPGSLPPVFSH